MGSSGDLDLCADCGGERSIIRALGRTRTRTGDALSDDDGIKAALLGARTLRDAGRNLSGGKSSLAGSRQERRKRGRARRRTDRLDLSDVIRISSKGEIMG